MATKFGRWIRVEAGTVDVTSGELSNVKPHTLNIDNVEEIEPSRWSGAVITMVSGEHVYTVEDYEELNVLIMTAEVEQLSLGQAITMELSPIVGGGTFRVTP